MSLADQLVPHLPQILVGQIVLMGVAILVGIGLILKKMAARGGSLEGDAGFAKERVAAELDHEIKRLADLRARLLQGAGAGATAISASDALPTTALETALAQTASPTPNPGPSAPIAGAAAPSADQAALEASRAQFKEAEEKHAKALKELQEQLDKAKNEIQAQAEAMASIGAASATVPQATAATPQESSARTKELQELQDRLKNLESVVKDYEIFEQDLALVKKYKSENEVLRKQISASHNVTEDDIAKLFTSMDADEPSQKTVISGGDDFFGADSIKTIPADSIKTIPADAPPKAATTEVVSNSINPAEPTSAQVASPELSASEIGSSGSTGENFQFGSAPKENALASEAPEDMEELAEASVNDDKLIKEFEKILGDKPT